MGTHPIFESDFDCLTECKNCIENVMKISGNIFVLIFQLISGAKIVRRIDPPTTAEMIAAEISSRIESYQVMSKKVSVLEKQLEKVAQENEVLEQRLNNFILEEHQHERKQQKTMKKYIRRLVENRQSTRQIRQQNKFISREVGKNTKYRTRRQRNKKNEATSTSSENAP